MVIWNKKKGNKMFQLAVRIWTKNGMLYPTKFSVMYDAKKRCSEVRVFVQNDKIVSSEYMAITPFMAMNAPIFEKDIIVVDMDYDTMRVVFFSMEDGVYKAVNIKNENDVLIMTSSHVYEVAGNVYVDREIVRGTKYETADVFPDDACDAKNEVVSMRKNDSPDRDAQKKGAAQNEKEKNSNKDNSKQKPTNEKKRDMTVDNPRNDNPSAPSAKEHPRKKKNKNRDLSDKNRQPQPQRNQNRQEDNNGKEPYKTPDDKTKEKNSAVNKELPKETAPAKESKNVLGDDVKEAANNSVNIFTKKDDKALSNTVPEYSTDADNSKKEDHLDAVQESVSLEDVASEQTTNPEAMIESKHEPPSQGRDTNAAKNSSNETADAQVHFVSKCDGGHGHYVFMIQSRGMEEVFYGEQDNTNDRKVSLQGIIESLSEFEGKFNVTVHTDSQYIVYPFIKGWIHKWNNSGWFKDDMERIQNHELWSELLNLSSRLHINWALSLSPTEQMVKCQKILEKNMSD